MADKKKIPASLRAKVLRRDAAFECVWCLVGRSDLQTADHVVAESRGGKLVVTNLVKCCGRCNDDKHNMAPHLWARQLQADLGLAPGATMLRVFSQMFAPVPPKFPKKK